MLIVFYYPPRIFFPKDHFYLKFHFCNDRPGIACSRNSSSLFIDDFFSSFFFCYLKQNARCCASRSTAREREMCVCVSYHHYKCLKQEQPFSPFLEKDIKQSFDDRLYKYAYVIVFYILLLFSPFKLNVQCFNVARQ